MHNKVTLEESILVIESLLEWIDSVPSNTVLPSMPGIDRDYVDSVLYELKKEIKDGSKSFT